jgi:hypothetical protein
MDAVAHKALRAIFKLHPIEMAGEILFEDIGMLPPLLTVHLANSVWLKRIQTSGGTMDYSDE